MRLHAKGTQIQKHICDHNNKLVKIVWGLEAELAGFGIETNMVKQNEQFGMMKAWRVGVGFEEQ